MLWLKGNAGNGEGRLGSENKKKMPLIYIQEEAYKKLMANEIQFSDIGEYEVFDRKKVNSQGIKKDSEPYSLEEFLRDMRKSPLPHIRVIADYAEEIGPRCATRGQWRQFVKRNVRAAVSLAPYTREQIEEAFARLKGSMRSGDNPRGYLTKWTLETLIKYLE